MASNMCGATLSFFSVVSFFILCVVVSSGPDSGALSTKRRDMREDTRRGSWCCRLRANGCGGRALEGHGRFRGLIDDMVV